MNIFIFRKNIADLDKPLFNSSNRKLWLEDYPTLDCFPKTLSYIDDPNSFPLSEVAKELANVELYLPKNEILFHSGNLPNKVSLAIGQEFQLKEIFSATLDPYIANVHDSMMIFTGIYKSKTRILDVYLFQMNMESMKLLS